MKKSLMILCKLEGANKERAIRVLNENNIVIENLVSKQNGGVFYFECSAKNQDKISSLLEKYTFSIVRQSRLFNLGKKLKKSAISIVAMVLCFFSIPFYNLFVWNVKVEGVSAVQSLEIKRAIKTNLVKPATLKASINVSDVNSYVLSSFDDISICSSVIYGTTLVLNVQEKIGIEEQEYKPVYAKFDGIVESVSITSGTANVKCGDIVRAGDVLILSHINRGDSLISCPALGEVKVRSFATFNKQFFNNEEKLVRTGNSFYVNYFTMFKNFVKIKCKKVQFEHFETEVLGQEEVGFLIPIKLYKTVVYELNSVIVTHNFDAEKNEFLRLFKLEVLSKLDGYSVSNVTEEIGECEGGYNIALTCEFMCTY